MHHDEVVIPDAVAQALLATQFPAWASLPVRRIAGDGTVNAIFRVGDDLTARFPLRCEPVADVERMLRREACALAAVAEVATVAAPRPVAIGAPAEGYPMPWSVQTWVPGAVATPTSVASSSEAAAEVADLVAAFRAVPTGGRPFHGLGRGGVLADDDAWVRECLSASAGLINVDAARRLWEDLGTEPPPAALAMTHGDLTPPNLLVTGDRLVGVLDGGGFGPADPALDLVVAWHLFDASARTVVRERLGSDDAEWRRGAGWALDQALGLVWYYATTNPGMAALGRSTVARLLAAGDLSSPPR